MYEFSHSLSPNLNGELLLRPRWVASYRVGFDSTPTATGRHYGVDLNGAFSRARGPGRRGPVAGLVGIEGGVVSGVINLESSGVRAPDWRPRHDKRYHEA